MLPTFENREQYETWVRQSRTTPDPEIVKWIADSLICTGRALHLGSYLDTAIKASLYVWNSQEEEDAFLKNANRDLEKANQMKIQGDYLLGLVIFLKEKGSPPSSDNNPGDVE